MHLIRNVLSLGERQSAASPTAPLDMTSNAATILAVNGVFTGVSLLIVLLRVYVRTIMLKTFGADDYFIVAAMVRDYPFGSLDMP